MWGQGDIFTSQKISSNEKNQILFYSINKLKCQDNVISNPVNLIDTKQSDDLSLNNVNQNNQASNKIEEIKNIDEKDKTNIFKNKEIASLNQKLVQGNKINLNNNNRISSDVISKRNIIKNNEIAAYNQKIVQSNAKNFNKILFSSNSLQSNENFDYKSNNFNQSLQNLNNNKNKEIFQNTTNSNYNYKSNLNHLNNNYYQHLPPQQISNGIFNFYN